jgi:Uma2 family endonuclease
MERSDRKPAREMRFEDVARLDPDCAAGELEAGRWVPVTRNTWRHGQIVVNVAVILRQYAREHGGFSVAAGDPGAKLSRDPDTLRGPDVGVVRVEREPRGTGAEGWLEGAPDLAVEVIGDRQSLSELANKALEYLEAGAGMVWLLDPQPERVMLFEPPNQLRILTRDEELGGGDVLPGFSCRVADLFE